MLLDVAVNEYPLRETGLFLQDSAGRLAVGEATLAKWNIRHEDAPLFTFEGENYLYVDSIPGSRAEINFPRQTVNLVIEPSHLEGTRWDFRTKKTKGRDAERWGATLNYELYMLSYGGQPSGYGLFETCLFGPYGYGVANILANSNIQEYFDLRFTRLDNYWTFDLPASATTVILGDGSSRAGSWGNSLRFGGIQLGTDFSLQPQFIKTPTQSISGQAARPSTIDIFVNNSKVGQEEVNAGPFTINDIPTVSGKGEITVRVRDVFGREELLTQSFFANLALLRKGVSEYNFDLGWQRERDSFEFADYTRFFSDGIYRYGLTDRFTMELRGEGARDHFAAGMKGTTSFSDLGFASATVAGSFHDFEVGAKLIGRFQSAGGGFLNYSMGYEKATRDFNQLGAINQAHPADQRLALSGGMRLGRRQSLGIAGVMQDNYNSTWTKAITASYSIGIFKDLSATLSATNSQSGEGDKTSLFLMFSGTLGPSHSLTFQSANSRGGGNDSSRESLVFTRRLPTGEGFGYRVAAHTDRMVDDRDSLTGRYDSAGDYLEASTTYRGSQITAQAQASTRNNAKAVSLDLSGAVGYLDQTLFLGRQLKSGFGMVRTGSIPNVEVYLQNHRIGETGQDGMLILPGLTPFIENRVNIDPRSVALDVTIKETKKTVVPGRRSGIVLDFPMEKSFSGTFDLYHEDDTPVAVGSSVRIPGLEGGFPVGFSGEAFVTGLKPGVYPATVFDGVNLYHFNLEVKESDGPLPYFGRYTVKK